MATFYESDNSPIASELVRQGFTLDRGEVLRIVDIDERASGTNTAIAIGAAVINLVAVCGTLALSGFTLPILAPLAALGYASLTAWNSRSTKQEREFEADFLHNHPEFVEAINQKLSAGEEGDRVAAAYEHTLKAFINGDKSRMQSFLPTVISHQMAPYPSDESLPAAAIATSSQIGSATKFGAVDVASARTVHNVPSSDPSDIAESLAVNLQSTLIVGQPGSGKGVCIAMATRAVKKLHPDVKIWAIDPKADPSEAWYWEAVDHYLPVRIDPFADAESMTGIMEAIDDFIQQFQDSDGAKLLIFDEALAVKEKTGRWFKGLMAGFNALCSMGRSRRQYGWLVSQSPNTDDFGISGGVRNVYRRILLISADNLGLLDNGSTYFSGKPSTENLKQTGRAFFDSIINSWGAVPFYSISDSSSIQPVAVPQREPIPDGESQRLKLEAMLQLDSSHEPIKETGFHQFADTLTHESQASLKSFVLWLETKKGSEVSYEQIKDSFARRADVGRTKEAIMPLVYAAKSKQLLTLLPNSNWLVSRG